MGEKDTENHEPPSLVTWLGMTQTPDWSCAKPLGALIGASLVALFTFAYVAAFAVAIFAITSVFGENAAGPNLGVGTLIAALLGAPFLIWRTAVAQKTVDLTAASQFNEKINAAIQDLYSQRQVTREDPNGDGRFFNGWDDDVIKRNAAIDRLLGLAEEAAAKNPKEVGRIASMLSVYVRELSKQEDLKAKKPPSDASPDNLRQWAWGLNVARSDMEKAVQVLGALRPLVATEDDKPPIDLRAANLQRMDLRDLDFEKADLSGAQLQGTNLSRAQLQGATLYGVQLQGASLSGAKLQGANLSGAELQGANLYRAQLQDTFLSVVQFDENTTLLEATLRGAAARLMGQTVISQLRPFWHDVFADGTVHLPDGEERPAHWETEELNDFRDRWRAWQATLPPESD